ncbi:MAG TPA: cytochrome P450 [Acetobacteraceae bacterium]|nr:cytochrome P450 [Acetobacteraceae bacterium]
MDHAGDPTTVSAPPAHVPPERVFDIDIYDVPGAASNFHLALQALRDQGLPDVFWTPRHGGYWVATRHADILRVFGDTEHFSSKGLVVPYEPERQAPLPPIHCDLPEHTAYRSLIATTFLPRPVAALAEKARAIAIELVEQLKPRGGCEFVTDFAQHLPIAVFMGIVDVPAEDREKLLAWADGMVRPEKREDVHDTLAQIFAYCRNLLADRKITPGTDLLSRISQGKVFGRPLTDDEMVAMCALVLIGGMDTVVSVMGFAAHFLATHPEHRRQLVQQPELIPGAVDELLRRFPVVNAGRLVAKEVALGGVTLKPGDMILLPTTLANLDGRRFANPLTVDFFRADATDYATFGKGPHRCPGANLGRSELRVFLEEWLQRIPEFSVAEGGKVGMSSGVNGTIYSLPLTWTP